MYKFSIGMLRNCMKDLVTFECSGDDLTLVGSICVQQMFVEVAVERGLQSSVPEAIFAKNPSQGKVDVDFLGFGHDN